jgi:hypothetical protein
MPHPIRLAILDSAADEANLWEFAVADEYGHPGGEVEIHPRRTVEEVMPHLLDLLREGHVEIYHCDDPQGPTLSLEEAVTAASGEANWEPATAKAPYCLAITESGEREYAVEYEAQHAGK